MAVTLFSEKEGCCGCRVCEHVCPVGAITVRADACGFLYPSIDHETCIECGTCKTKCAFQAGYPRRKEFEPFRAYAVRHRNPDVMAQSRSGGAFVALSDVILTREGIVYGCRFEEGSNYRRAVHACADTAQKRLEFCGSKYIQSDLGDTFPKVKSNLEQGRLVLYSGTGCQIGALHKYLGREFDNLVTLDIVCFGASSPRLWAEYLAWIESRYGLVTKADFRDKGRFGWRTHKETIITKRAVYSSRAFAALFQAGAIRPSCFECRYSNTDRPGDITLADFWGHEKIIADKWDDDKGISLVLINTQRGMNLWRDVLSDVEVIDCTGSSFRHQSMKHPANRWNQYDQFWEDFIVHGFKYSAKKYAGKNVLGGVNVVVTESVPRKIRKCLGCIKPLKEAYRKVRWVLGI